MPEYESRMAIEAALMEFKKAWLAANEADNNHSLPEEEVRRLKAESDRLEGECKKAGATIQEILKNSTDQIQ